MALRLTEPLLAAEDGLPVYSDGYRLITLVETYWIVAGAPLRLDEWQKHLLIRILERCPPGHPREGQLRYRQVVVSIPRQAGKSLLAAVLSIYGLLMHSPGPKVLGVARTAKQADIVYGYARDAINQSDALSGLLRTTGTRGITKTAGLGTYVVLAAKEESVQGFMATLAIADELHVLDGRIWDALVAGGRAQENPLLIGITTAGDITSTLLKRLYAQGQSAINGEQETFGFFCWEASDATTLTLEAITEANPAVACGRISAQSILDDDKATPPSFWKRFTLNRFVEGLAEPWIGSAEWKQCAGTGLEDFKDCVYSVVPTDRNGFVTIYAAKKIDGKTRTAVVARLVKPSLDELKNWTDRLYKSGRCTFAMDPRRMRALTEYLDDKNRNPIRIYGDRKADAARIVYGLVMSRAVEHDSQSMVDQQHQSTYLKKDILDGKEIDLAEASVYAIYAAEITKKRGLGIV